MRVTCKRACCCCTAICLVITVMLLSSQEQQQQQSETLNEDDAPIINPDELEPFEPSVNEDFPTNEDRKEPLIPHVFHQTHSTEYVPHINIKSVKSLIQFNPTWDYFFWTNENARDLIARRHPQLIDVFDNFINPIERSDLLRYVVLYEIGGVYLDTDVEVIRPLNRVTYKYTCIIPSEPFEHSSILYKRDIVINNAIIFCRSRHPFLKQLLQNIGNSTTGLTAIDRTGPVFVTEQYFIFMHTLVPRKSNTSLTYIDGNEPFVVRRNCIADNCVYIPNTIYFNHQYDKPQSLLVENCKLKNKPPLVKRGCLILAARKTEVTSQFEYTRHHWVHTWSHVENDTWLVRLFKFLSKLRYGSHTGGIHIRDIVKNVKIS